uniref:Uncharacterized protein n=1 Tax=uncultured marine virus TaxID=186617 RepID=A0A0F7L3U5_9VIRU|nr:hypothetical protein [uncultured marine virus]
MFFLPLSSRRSENLVPASTRSRELLCRFPLLSVLNYQLVRAQLVRDILPRESPSDQAPLFAFSRFPASRN